MDAEAQQPRRGWLDPSKQEVILRVLNTDMRGWIISVPQGTSLIGREPDCQLHLPHYTISRRHCSLQVMPDSIEIRDLNSMNGTAINGSPAIEGTLQPGDKVRVGEVELSVDIRARVPGQNPPTQTGPASLLQPAPQHSTTSAPVFHPPPTLPPILPPAVAVGSAAPAQAPLVPQPPAPEPTGAEASMLQSSQYSYHLPTPSWAVRPHLETVRYREAKRTVRFDPSRRDAFRQFRSD
ncbi:MAG TPA: FHA domain-containing protein [Verrucomicrobiae bacterium]|nr:FHA domain-containing protein [Verrucomicrobiae bacterium]